MAARRPRPRPARPEFRLETLESRVLYSADAPLVALVAPGSATPHEPPALEASASTASADGHAAHAAIAAAGAHELVVVDAAVPDLDALLADLARRGEAGPRVVVLEPGADPLARLGQILAAERGLGAVHLISHGADGELALAGQRVTTLDLLARAGEIAGWRGAFAEGADLLLYGCDVAASAQGQSFVDTLARLSGADVAASSDVTGAVRHGGNWRLEYARGEIGAGVAVSEALQGSYLESFATYTVSNLNDAGAGSLRQALIDANASGTDDLVQFTVAGAIDLTSALPSIADRVTIDATTAPGYTNAPVVTLDGSAIGDSSADGLHLDSGSDGSTVRGLAIVDFGASGIRVSNSGSHVIESNYIGTDGTGERGNGGAGIALDDAHDNVIGGAGARNVISGNDTHGVHFSGVGSTRNVIAGNYIGTDASGTAAVANGIDGVAIDGGANDNTVGLAVTGGGNLISGNTGSGVLVRDGATSANVIQGNTIGLARDGLTALANGNVGVFVWDAVDTTVGGTTAAERNVLSGNTAAGVVLFGPSATLNTVAGNYIGTDKSGTDTVANGFDGVQIYGGASDNTIGGSITAARNVISGNGRYGVMMLSGTTTGNSVLGNYIGIAVDGDTKLGNGSSGVLISTSANANTIGGSTDAERNVISGNAGHGVRIFGSGTDANRLIGNLIGTDATGAASIGNGEGGVSIHGVAIGGGARDNEIGGDRAAGLGNVISGNAGSGVDLDGAGTSGNRLEGNLIGVRSDGDASLGNGFGVTVRGGASDNAIGGHAASLGNQVSGNLGDGISVSDGASTGNSIVGNLVGTDAAGLTGLSNARAGVRLVAGASANFVGDGTPGGGNVISGNGHSGIMIDGAGTDANRVLGNLVGIGADGAMWLGNGWGGGTAVERNGIVVGDGAASTVIGGTTANERNIVSDNRGDGVHIDGDGTDGTVVSGNYIGLGADGALWRGNGSDGVSVSAGAEGTMIGHDAGSYAGNVIAGNAKHGVFVASTTTTDTAIRGNLVGTAADGLSGRGNGWGGIYLDDASGTIVGGATVAERNVVSGNGRDGIRITGSGATLNIVTGNYVGTDALGAAALPNGLDGVLIGGGAAANTIGGDRTAGLGNLISGNTGDGVRIEGVGSDANAVLGNRIGTDAAGTADLGNGGNGIVLFDGVQNTRIGDAGTGEGNLIAGNDGHGILVDGNALAATTANAIEANVIGLDATGAAPLANTAGGIRLTDGASANTVGGDRDAGEGNTVAGHAGGVGIRIDGATSAANVVAGNLVGTDPLGTSAFANATGILNRDAPATVIGGLTSGEGNLVSGNTGVGVLIDGATSTDLVLYGNLVGTTLAGTAALGNGGVGVQVSGGASRVTVGGTAAGAGNRIAHNAASGIGVAGASSSANALLGNALFANAGLGIDLGLDGVTLNDDGSLDADGGPNALQNAPVLERVGTDGSSTIELLGSLDSEANRDYRIELFASTVADASGRGEAERYLGAASVTTDAAGIALFDVTLGGSVTEGEFVSATATRDLGAGTYGDTSELSTNAVAREPNASPVFTSPASFSLPENTTAVGTVGATDANADSLTYAIAGGADAAPFGIDAVSGALTFDGAPNFESPTDADTDNLYEVEVSATDSFGASTVQSVAVTVTAVNEAPVFQAAGVPAFTSHDIATDADVAVSVATADVDGDGDMDVLSASVFDDRIVWYENDGGGGFTPHTIATDADGARSVTAADVDGDGDVDVLSASETDDRIVWYENDGSENFIPHTIAADAGGAVSVTTADVDGDGDVDVLSASYFDDRIVWYENDGSESFTAHDIAADANGAYSVATADVDGDGDVDVLSASTSDDRIVWYENDGGGGFTAHDIATDADGARSVTTADVDGDGDVDVLSASMDDDRIVWYENDGGESFSAHTIAADADGAVSVTTADVDGDGDVDVLSASEYDDRIVWYENDGSESFTPRTIATDAAGAQSVTTADVDGDGDVDVLSVSYIDSRIAWYENDASMLDANPTYVEGGPAVVLGKDVAVSDAELDALNGGSGNYAGAELTLARPGGANAEDVFGFADGNGLTLVGGNLIRNGQVVGVFDTGSAPGELAVTFTDAGGEIPTRADVESVSSQITYANASDAPPSSVRIEWVLDDGSTGAQGSGGPLTATDDTVVTITPTNDAPTFGSTPVTAASEDAAYAYAISADDVDAGDTLTIGAPTLPSWLALTDNGDGTASLSGTPTNAEVGDHAVTLEVSDGTTTATQSFTVTVANTNDAPTFGSTPVTVASEDAAYAYAITADDVDAGDALTIGAPTLPAWLTLTDNGDGTASLAGTPTNAEVGNHAVTLEVSDGTATTVQGFTVTAANTNDAPTFGSTPVTAASEDTTYSYAIAAGDADAGDTLAISASTLPSWLALTDNGDGTASLAGTPTNAEVGDHAVTLEVSDGTTTATQSFTVTVSNTNDAPTFGSTPVTAASEDAAYAYAISAGDVDAGDTLAISAPTLPAWLTLMDNGDGTASLAGTPTNAEVGDHAVTLEVSDGTTTATQSFTVTVSNTNDAPTFGSTPVTTASEDAAYAYAISADDVDAGDTLTISASTLPAWLTLTDNGDGTASLAGTPTNAEVGDHAVTLEVSDGTTTATQSFTVTVANTNDAPTFGSTPVTTASEDAAYAYAISAGDVDAGDTLTIGAPTLPSWLALTDNGDGTASLSGTPTNAEVGDHAVTLEVSDGTTTATQSFTVTVSNTNDAPTFGSTPVTTASEDAAYAYAISADDVDAGDTLTINAPTLPSWLALTDNGDGTASLSGTPTNAEVGDHAVTLEVSDGTTTATQSFTVTVANTNDAPTFGSTPVTAASEDAAYAYAISADDVDAGDTLTIGAPTLPSWLALTDNGDGTASLSGTPTNAEVGDHAVTLEVSDGTTTATQSFTVTVANTNDAPTFGSTPVTVASEDAAYAYAITADDVDAGDALTIGAPTLPAWLTLTDNGDGTASLAGTPTNAEVGNHAVTLEVSDGTATTVQGFTVTAANTNDAPTFGSTPVTAASEDTTYSYAIAAGDADAGDTLAISASTLPSWLALTDNGDGTASLAGTPTNAEVGDHAVTLEVSDGTTTATQSFTVTVSNTNDAPTFGSTPVTAASEDAAYAYAISAGDVDAGDTLAISAPTLPAWLTLMDNGDGTASLAGTPTNAEVGDHAVTLEVSDGTTTATQSFTVTVSNTNDAPTFGSTPVTTASEDAAYAYAISADDVDAGDTLTISASTLPAWLTLTDNGDGTASLAGTPTNAEVGDHAVTLEVSDGTTTATQSFTVTVANTNDAPTFGSTPVTTASEDAAYAYAITADDVDAGDTLTIGAPTLPSWLALTDNGDGTASLSGTPTNAEVGDHAVTLEVSDGTTTATQSFTVTVANTNDAPTFGSTPVTVASEDAAYAYAISAGDVDAGDTLAISAPTLPAWLTLMDNGDGTASLAGTPTNAEVGDHAVTLEVSDGTATTVQSFTVTVANTNDAPTFGSTPVTVASEDAAYAYAISAGDVDAGDTLTISASTLPAWLTLTDNGDGTASLSGTPTNAEVGDHAVTLEVSDGTTTATQSFTVTVANTNDAPTFGSTPVTVASEDAAYAYAISAGDVDAGDTLAISAPTLPAWLTLMDNGDGTASLAGTPTNAEVGDHAVTLEVSDGTATTVQSFTVTVANTNDAPTFGSTPVTVASEDAAYAYAISAGDVDAGDTLTISASTLPAWLTLTDNGDGTASLSGTSTNAEVGDHAVVLEVFDGTATTVQGFTVTVSNVNDAPVISSDPDPVVPENRSSVITVTASDVDAGATLTYGLAGGPDRDAFAIDATTGELRFLRVPDHETRALYELEVSVSDGTLTDTQRLSVTVSDVDEPPLARPDTLSTDEDTARTIDVAAELLANDTDPEAGPLRLVSATAPAHGTLVTGADGVLEYRPGPDFHGSDGFEYTVADAGGARSTARVTIEVAAVNDPPVLAPGGPVDPTEPAPRPGVIDAAALGAGPLTIEENAGTAGLVQAVDVDDAQVRFELGGADAARFEIDPLSGALRPRVPLDFEAPVDADGDNRYELELVLTDGSGAQSRVGLTIVAADVNEAPRMGDVEFAVTADRTGAIGRLEGSDPDRDERLVYERVGGEDGSGGLRVGADGRLYADGLAVGVHEFEVRVVDASGLWSVGRVTVTVVAARAPTPGGPGEPSLGALAPESPSAPAPAVTMEGPVGSEPEPGSAPAPEPRSPVRDIGPVNLRERTFAPAAVPAAAAGPLIDHQFDPVETRRYEAREAALGVVRGETRSEESAEGLERGTVQAPFVPGVPAPLSTQLREAIEAMVRELDEREAGREGRERMAGMVVAVGGVTLSVGAALWLVQSRLLLAAALAAMPLWRPFDPVPILIGGGRSHEDEDGVERDEPPGANRDASHGTVPERDDAGRSRRV